LALRGAHGVAEGCGWRNESETNLSLLPFAGKGNSTEGRKDHKELTLKTAVAKLKTEKKHFIDGIKLIAYGAESALAGEIREALSRDDDARALLRRLFVTPASLRPDPVAQTPFPQAPTSA
jgi:hypothetical protein